MTSPPTPEAHLDLGPRTLHQVLGPDAGPTVLCVCALHGNEHAGVAAVQRVTQQVGALIRGEWIALLGNRAAAAMGVRYTDRDLNRRWMTEPRGPSQCMVEDREQDELRDALDVVFRRARGPVYVIDLHTTSGPGKPFTVFADTLHCRAAAYALPIPMILGLDEHLDGTLVDYVAGLGHAAIAVEGGSHVDAASSATLEAAILVMLDAAGLIDRRAISIEDPTDRLRRAARGIPHALEIRHRHPVTAGDRFRMHAGFASFDRVRRGQLLARDRSGEIHARQSGYLLMPLYQAQGDDGFFLVSRVWQGWLSLSRWLRKARVDSLVPYFPGVRSLGNSGVYTVDRRIARWGALGLMHLLGYRRESVGGSHLRVKRRKHDPL